MREPAVRDVLDAILEWYSAGRTFGLATVVSTFRSAPREPGASMAVSADGEVVGSVSGGCVEGAVYETARQVMESGLPVLEKYGVSDDDAFAVGLTCGGILHVFVEPVDRRTFPELAEVAAAVAGRRPVAVATVVTVPGAAGGPGAGGGPGPDGGPGAEGGSGAGAASVVAARGG
nr:hypothetical protein GCM10020093_043590 [Planobispora longispora]